MIKFNAIVVLVISLVTVAGCSKTSEELLVGHWECNGQEEGMKFSGSVEYVSNGKSNAIMEMRGTESGVPIIFELIGRGTWQINDTELLESIESITVTRFNVGGQEVPPENFPQEFKDAMVGVSTGSEIVQLDERVLLTNSAGTQMTCSRK